MADAEQNGSGPTDFGDPNSDDFDWEGFMGQHFGTEPAPDPEAGVAPGEAPEDASQVTPSDESAATAPEGAPGASEEGASATEDAPGTIDVGGVQIPTEYAANVANLWHWMNDHPQEAGEFMGYLLGEKELVDKSAQLPLGTAPPVPETVEAPAASASIDLGDMSGDEWEFVPEPLKKSLQALADQNSTLMQRQAALDEANEVYARQAAEQQQRTVYADVEAGIGQFKESYPDLTDQEVVQLRDHAAGLQILPGLVTQMGDTRAATARSLEIAYFATPEFREREQARAVEAATQQTQEDTTRKRKLGALAGSGGATPREQAPPSTPEAKRAAMVSEIATVMYGGQNAGGQ